MHASSPGSSASTASSEGTPWSTVIPSRRTVSTRYAGSRWPSGRASTSRAPSSSGAQYSHTEASKPAGVFTSTRSSGARGKRRRIQAMCAASARWGTATPFGVPVEPEVCRT